MEAYLQLNEEEQQQFEQLLHQEPYQEIEPMMVTTYEKGVAKGREEGRQEGRQEAARLLLERKFGPLNAAVLARLAAWPAERLDELLLSVLDAPSLLALGLQESDGKS